ncbi:MAG: SET domain-containing protein [Burkholderiales bacterium]
MLLVSVVLRPSPIHGLGAFAVAPIARGTPVWRFTPGFDLDLDPAALERQPEHFRKALLHYGYLDPRLQRYILCCDDARFINHSAEPNLASEYSADRYGVDVAAREIAAGEELTIDYGLVEGPVPPAQA